MDYLNEIIVSYKSTKIAKKDIRTSTDAYYAFLPHFEDEMDFRESVKVLFLNRANEPIGIFTVSTGGVSGTALDNKILFSVAVKCLASAMILCHNHPSGNLKPSSKDIEVTKEIKKAAELLHIKLLDHIILTSVGYFSFKDEFMF